MSNEGATGRGTIARGGGYSPPLLGVIQLIKKIQEEMANICLFMT